jgi:hypothetical protein
MLLTGKFPFDLKNGAITSLSPLLSSSRFRCLAKSRLCRDYRRDDVLLHFSGSGLDNWMYNAARRNPC